MYRRLPLICSLAIASSAVSSAYFSMSFFNGPTSANDSFQSHDIKFLVLKIFDVVTVVYISFSTLSYSAPTKARVASIVPVLIPVTILVAGVFPVAPSLIARYVCLRMLTDQNII